MSQPTNQEVDTVVFKSCQEVEQGRDYYQLFGILDKTFFEDLGGVEVDYMLEDSLNRLIDEEGRLVEVDTFKNFARYLYRVA